MENDPLNKIDPTGEVAILAPALPALGQVMVDVATVGLGMWALTPDSDEYSPARRQAEYQRMKNRCDKKPPKTGDKCSDLSREIDHYENCASWYEYWDRKWLPGRHAEKIQNWRNRAKKLKDEYNKECVGKLCP